MTGLKASEIVKPSRPGDFLRLQLSCIPEMMEKMQFLARFDHRQNHLPAKPLVELIVVYEVSQAPMRVSLLVSDRIEQVISLFEKTLSGKQIARELGIAWVELHKGLLLQPVCIPKPWGQEIWYSGIEARGVSQVKTEEGVSPLDWVIAAADDFILGDKQTPVLLKILDPLPDDVYGDLYVEMHDEKREVYVVTGIDKQAWPDGKGGIRFGFNQSLRKSFASDHAFRQAYLESVQAYQEIRQQIDTVFDKKRQQLGIPLNEPLMPEITKKWQQELPANLVNEEKQRREKMENFIAIKKLQLGDVVKVPCLTPHSLQHGVRTVEFQTPVYERKILSFAQKVLTQGHWDTAAAIDRLLLDVPADVALDVVEVTKDYCREQVVRFDDFFVERISMAADAILSLPKDNYHLLLVIKGEVMIEGETLAVEQARLLPLAYSEMFIRACCNDTVVLVATPL